VRKGSDVTVFSTGVQTVRAYEAAEILAGEGIDVHLVHVPTLKPLDEEAIVQAARATGFVITTEEHSIIGGLGGAVAELLADRNPVPVKRHGLADIFGESGPDQALLEKYGISVDKTAEAIRALVRARVA
jgi:transketolase